MSERTDISWCDSTFNPWIGCTEVSLACDHCYAARQDRFRKWTPEGWGGPRRRTSAALWKGPAKWNKEPFVECLRCQWRGPDNATLTIDNPPGFHPPVAWMRGCPACRQPTLKEARRRVFCASLADVFDNEVPPEWRADLFALIEKTPSLDWLLLTKRIGNARDMMFLARGGHLPLLPNVWLGATICNQTEADRDIPKLLAVPAAKRFLSIEPMLGPVKLSARWLDRCDRGSLPGPGELGGVTCPECDGHGDGCKRLHWVIAGGESGPQARPMHPDWVRSLRSQCAAAGVPFHFKQWGAWAPYDRGRNDSAQLATPGSTDTPLQRFGAQLSGRRLDGRIHDAFPA